MPRLDPALLEPAMHGSLGPPFLFLAVQVAVPTPGSCVFPCRFPTLFKCQKKPESPVDVASLT